MFDFGNDYDFMEGIDAFPAYIYKTKFDFKFNSFKEKVDEYLKESKRLSTKYNWGDPEHGDAITGVHFNNMSDTWDVPHNWDEFDKFNEYLKFVVPFLMHTWFHAPPCNMSVNESWINVHRKGGFTEAHHHQNATIAIAAYLDVPEGSGNLLIENPLRPYKCSEPLGDTDLLWGPIEVETNDVLFFPGWLTHKTEKNETNNPRYILSTNLSHLPNYEGVDEWNYVGRNK